MSGLLPRRRLVSSRWWAVPTLAILWLVLSAFPAQAQPRAAAPAKAEQIAAALFSPEALPQVLADGAAGLEDKLKSLQSRLAESQQKLARTETDLRGLQVAAASLKAALAVERPSLTQAQELLATYKLLETQAKERAQALSEEMATLSQEIAAQTLAENTLRNQVEVLQGLGEPTATLPETQQALSRYLQLADSRVRQAAQVWNNLDKTSKALDQELQLLAGLEPDLKNFEATWKAELLAKPVSEKPLREQLAGLWASLLALPAHGWRWLGGVVATGALGAFFRRHLFRLTGLAVLLALLGWSTRRLRRFTAKRFKERRKLRPDLELLPIFVLGQILVDSLLLLGSIFWLGVIFWNFGILNKPLGRLVLNLMGVWWALRLALSLVQAFFAGRAAAGVLPLDSPTARFYRRSLKVLAFYLALGILALKSAPLLNFPETSTLLAEHLFLVGLLVWILWLLRRRHLARFQPLLPNPAWVRRPLLARIIKGTGFTLLMVIIVADLLGFSNLAVYVARAAAWTVLASILFWFLWLMGAAALHQLFHPEHGWVQDRYPGQPEMWNRVYRLSMLLLSALLGAAVLVSFLASWGIPPDRLAWAFRWLSWGPSLGPLKLSPLNIAGAILVFYLGFGLSRLFRELMRRRIFPRTGLEYGVQYTITTTVHYVILILAALLAIDILGFPLTNLALVIGALGIGIGFGLQNIVNNFISGLILLFERPIKVGDTLVVDGQWGTVKEIRVRSTVFETVDRSVLIIPNSELISHKVLNWTHYGRGINRLSMKIRVGYDSDVRQVTQLLAEICRTNPRVLEEPPPSVSFEVYGESSLDFTVSAYLGTQDDRGPALHELNSAIVESFRQHGIRMPFPQQDLHIKDWPGPPASGQ